MANAIMSTSVLIAGNHVSCAAASTRAWPRRYGAVGDVVKDSRASELVRAVPLSARRELKRGVLEL